MTTMEVVVIAAAIVAAIVVLYNLWIKVVIPTWEFMVEVKDRIVDAYDVVKEFIVDYIINPIKAVKKKIRRKFFQTDIENIMEDRDDMRDAAEKLQKAVNWGMVDQEQVDMLREGAEAIDQALTDAGVNK